MIWTEHSTQFSLRWAGNRGQKSGAVNLPPLILAPVKEISSRDRWFCWPAWGVKKCRNTGFLCLPSTLWCIQGRETIILPPELCKTLLWLFFKTYSSDFFPRPVQLLEHFSLLPITTIFTSPSRSTEHLEDSGGPFHHPDTAAWVCSLRFWGPCHATTQVVCLLWISERVKEGVSAISAILLQLSFSPQPAWDNCLPIQIRCVFNAENPHDCLGLVAVRIHSNILS